MTDDLIVNKLIDRIKTAIKFRANPNQICIESRISCEAMLKLTYKREYGQVPPSITFEKLKEGVVKKGVLPSHIVSLFDSIQRLGNKTAHIDEHLTDRSISEALVVENSLGNICNWFFNEYLNIELSLDNLYDNLNESQNSILINYEHLIRSALSDKKLEIDEFEEILKARDDLKIDFNEAIKIERKICHELLQVKVNDISEILISTDLKDFRKFDKSHATKPDWVLKIIQNETTIDDSIKRYLSFYFDEIKVFIDTEQIPLLSILGCWQGWYFQYSSKTYFDLFFIAKGDNDFIGLSIEPINPQWQNKGYQDPHLLAWIEGSLEEEILFSYTKKYLLERSWSIKYVGVLLEMGHGFEGEWTINELNGTFNAIRTKSLLPIRIFDTENLLPIIPTTYLNRRKDLTSSWLIQIIGKTSIVGIMHILELRGLVYANLIIPDNDSLIISYIEGEYEESSKITLSEIDTVIGNCNNLKLNFNIDWSTNTFNGIIKDNIHKMRVIKGYKI
jgi:hypothetical protein